MGSVDGSVFETMLTGELPNGIVLPGKGNHQEQRRAGFDATFSAPKSVSIAALLKDDRLIEVHQQSVKTALKVAETRYAQDREWNRETKVVEVKPTGNLVIALFLHDTSRDLDPNLHTHAVILNGTKDASGDYRALYTKELYAHRKLLDDIYLNELAHRARQLGYEIEPTPDGFELTGYTQELRDTFSQRRRMIELHVAEQIENGAVAAGKLYQQAALATRTQKREVNHEALIDNWAGILAAKGLTLPTTPVIHPQSDLTVGGQMQAIVAARDGINHAEERESVFRRGKVERFALEHHLGLQSWRQLYSRLLRTGLLDLRLHQRYDEVIHFTRAGGLLI
jgi:conjugative relaxase-like TrwC/TraI family protein